VKDNKDVTLGKICEERKTTFNAQSPFFAG
jgi:hypothetical protein